MVWFLFIFRRQTTLICNPVINCQPPGFQRRNWTLKGKSLLIDSILRGMPLPQFFIRETVLPKEKRTVREVVDGQQRLSAVLSFIEGGFTVLPIHNREFASLKCQSELTEHNSDRPDCGTDCGGCPQPSGRPQIEELARNLWPKSRTGGLPDANLLEISSIGRNT
jgi:hypothetical protein